MLTYLAEELRTGDVAVAGAQAYADSAGQLLSPAQCSALLPPFCAEVGLAASAAGFQAQLQARLTAQAAESGVDYPDNADLVIDEQGTATLKRRRAAPPSPTALALEAELTRRMPERTLLGDPGPHRALAAMVAPLRPGIGIRPKLGDAFFRYVLATFTHGSNLGPARAARHIAGVSAHELGATARRHVTIGKLNSAIATS